jgi:Tol biopolymer transport system component
MDADGSNQQCLTDNPAWDLEPYWSPDGSRIVFTSNRDGNYEIYVMDADGSNQQRLTDNPARDSHPSWSPDGSRIAFHSNRDGNMEIYMMDADGSNQQRLTYNYVHDEIDRQPCHGRVAFLVAGWLPHCFRV